MRTITITITITIQIQSSPDSVIVEVVEDGQTALIALAVVWLGATGPGDGDGDYDDDDDDDVVWLGTTGPGGPKVLVRKPSLEKITPFSVDVFWQATEKGRFSQDDLPHDTTELHQSCREKV